MDLLFSKAKEERGSVLVISLLFMISLTLIGVAATNTSTIEQQIAGNDKFHKMAFYNADSGIYCVPKIIHEYLVERDDQISFVPGGILIPSDQESGWSKTDLGNEDFYMRITGQDPDPDELNPDVVLDFEGDGVVDDTDTLVDVVRKGDKNNWAKQKAGGGAEFSSEGRGMGQGGAGGSVDILYDFNSWGFGPSNSRSIVLAEYRKVLDVPGGL